MDSVAGKHQHILHSQSDGCRSDGRDMTDHIELINLAFFLGSKTVKNLCGIQTCTHANEFVISNCDFCHRSQNECAEISNIFLSSRQRSDCEFLRY